MIFGMTPNEFIEFTITWGFAIFVGGYAIISVVQLLIDAVKD